MLLELTTISLQMLLAYSAYPKIALRWLARSASTVKTTNLETLVRLFLQTQTVLCRQFNLTIFGANNNLIAIVISI